MNEHLINFYKKRTVFENGFDFTMYIQDEMENANILKCKSPVFVGIRITTDCNMNCPHCFAKDNKKKMTFETFKKIIDKLVENEIYKITITGGEPFTNEALMDMLREAKSNRLVVSLQTNGSLLTEKAINTLAKILTDEDWVQISFDGFDENTYKQTRGSSGFKKIYENIVGLVSAGLNVKLNVVVTNKNYKFLDKIYEVGEELKVKKISFSPEFGCINENAEVFFPRDKQVFMEMKKVIEKNIKNDNALPIDIDGLAVPCGCKEFVECGFELGKLTCPAGKTSCEIDVNGDVYPCPFLFEEDFFMGNILEQSVEELWKSKNLDELRKPQWTTEKVCLECESLSLCNGGCFAVAKKSNYDCDIRCDKIRSVYQDADFK